MTDREIGHVVVRLTLSVCEDAGTLEDAPEQYVMVTAADVVEAAIADTDAEYVLHELEYGDVHADTPSYIGDAMKAALR